MELGDAHRLGTGLLRRSGLDAWALVFDGAKRRAGVCRYADRVIGLSAPLTRLHDEREVRETVLHEIAHALVGPRHGHDAVWAARVRELGGSPRRCLPEDSPQVPAAWLGVCPAGHTVERHRRPERVMACRQCAPAFSVEHLLEWTHRGRPAAMHPNYLRELDALLSGRRLLLAGVGTSVRLLVPGPLHGRVARVVRRGRTSYHVELPEGRHRVLFAAVEPLRPRTEPAQGEVVRDV